MPLVSQPALQVRQAPGQGNPSINDSRAPAGEEPGFYTSSDNAFEGNIAQERIITPALCYAGFWKFVFSA